MPVWPICFCTCWPKVYGSNWLPTAMTCTSRMVRPASSRAPRLASAARSRASRSRWRRKGVIAVPMIHTSSLIAVSPLGRVVGVAERDRLGSVVVGAGPVGDHPDRHVEVDGGGFRGHVDEVGLHEGTVVEAHQHRDEG